MTKEEAIARIKEHKNIHKMNESRAILISEALDMAIEALEQETMQIPKDATNGDVIKAMFPCAEIVVGRLKGETIDMVHLRNNNMTDASFYRDWWNAPYKESEEIK